MTPLETYINIATEQGVTRRLVTVTAELVGDRYIIKVDYNGKNIVGDIIATDWDRETL